MLARGSRTARARVVVLEALGGGADFAWGGATDEDALRRKSATTAVFWNSVLNFDSVVETGLGSVAIESSNATRVRSRAALPED